MLNFLARLIEHLAAHTDATICSFANTTHTPGTHR